VLDGTSERARPDDAPFGVEVAGNAALFKGDYKIVRNGPPLGDGEWKLYDLAADPGETNDLAKTEPERVKAMLADYDTYKQEMGVLDLPEGYSVQRQVEKNAIARQLGFYWWVLVLFAVVLIGALYGVWRLIMRLRRA